MKGIVTRVSVSKTGMPKHAVIQAMVSAGRVEGDRPRNRKIHGGPDRAVCLFSEELYQWIRDHEINVSAGDLGENITTQGINLDALQPGDCLRIGICEIQITAVREPCNQLKKWSAELPKLILGRSGWMARVNKAGIVRLGDAIEIIRLG